MSKLEEEREELKFDIEWEKRAKKILLICTAICGGLGLIIGVSIAISEGIFGVALGGIWLGIGFGGAITFVPLIFRVHMREDQESPIWVSIIFFLFFAIIGPVGLLIRILRLNHRINNLENELNALGK